MMSSLAPIISVNVTAKLNTPLVVGQTGTTLSCDVSGADNLRPMITYQWSKDHEPLQGGESRVLTLSPLRLSHAGNYTCNATVSSTLLDENISASSHQIVTIQSELIVSH